MSISPIYSRRLIRRSLAALMGATGLVALGTGAFAAQGDNLALGKPVSMSSEFGTTAQACTDGDTNGDFTVTQGCQTTASAMGTNREWIEIDLGQDYIIERIVLWNRTDVAGASNWVLTTSRAAAVSGVTGDPSSAIDDTNVNSLTYADGQGSGSPSGTGAGPNYTSLNLSVGIHIARYVRIFNLAPSQALQFAEIQVIEGPPPVRVFINAGFELPALAPNSNAEPPESEVPGWSTTETVTIPSPYTAGGNIEIWSQGFLGVSASEGSQWAELNAFTDAALSQQPLCVYPSENFAISFLHRGRTGVDVASLFIGTTKWITVTDNNGQGGTHSCTSDSGSCGTPDATDAKGWTRHHTSYTNNSGVPQVLSFAFAAVSTAGGNPSIGNFFDDVEITGLKAAVEFSSATASGPESVATANLPKLLVNGSLTAAETVEVAITGGTAMRGVDYSTVPPAGNLLVTIPAGNYDGTLATAISLATVIQIVPDADTPPTPESIEMALVNPSAGVAISGASACRPAVAAHTYEILPTPSPLLTLVKQAPSAFVFGQPGDYTLQVINNGGADTSGTITVTDPIPEGLTINDVSGSGWTCSTAGQTVTCTTNQIVAASGGMAPIIIINVTPQLSANGQQLTNSATVSGGGDTLCPTDPRCSSTVTTSLGFDVPTLSGWLLCLLASLLLALGWFKLRAAGRPR